MNSFFSFIFTKTPLVFFAQSIWRDEAFSFLLSQKSIKEILMLTARDSNPPLYYLLLHFWTTYFGKSEVTLRSLSLIFFCLTGYVFFLFLRNIFHYSFRRSIFYLLLFVANPLLHYYAFEARMYTMFAFFALTSYYFFVKRNYTNYAIQILLGLLTHYFMVFVLMSQIVYLFIIHSNNNKRQYFRSLAVSCLLFLPWILFVLAMKPTVNSTFWIAKPNLLSLIQLPGIILTGFESDLWYRYPLLIPFSIILILIISTVSFAIIKTKKANKNNASLFLLLCVWCLFTPFTIMCISFIKPIFLPRYLIFSTIGLLLFFAYSFPKTHRIVEIMLFIVVLTISLQYAQIQIKNRKKANIREVAKIIKALINHKDVVYVTHEFNFHPLQYYINNKQVYIYGKTYDILPWYIGKVLISPDNIAQSLPLYPQKAFILKDDLSFTIEALY